MVIIIIIITMVIFKVFLGCQTKKYFLIFDRVFFEPELSLEVSYTAVVKIKSLKRVTIIISEETS